MSTDFKVNMDIDEYPTPDNHIPQTILIQLKLIYYSGDEDNFWTAYFEGECESNTAHTISTDASLQDIMNLINSKNKFENLRVVEITQWINQMHLDDAQDIGWLTDAHNYLYFKDDELHPGIFFMRIRNIANYY